MCSEKPDSILDVLIQLKVSTPQTVGVKTKSDVVSAATKWVVFVGGGGGGGREGGKTLPNFGHQSCWAVWLGVSVGKCQWRWSLISFNISDPVSEFYQSLAISAVEELGVTLHYRYPFKSHISSKWQVSLRFSKSFLSHSWKIMSWRNLFKFKADQQNSLLLKKALPRFLPRSAAVVSIIALLLV